MKDKINRGERGHSEVDEKIPQKIIIKVCRIYEDGSFKEEMTPPVHAFFGVLLTNNGYEKVGEKESYIGGVGSLFAGEMKLLPTLVGEYQAQALQQVKHFQEHMGRGEYGK